METATRKMIGDESKIVDKLEDQATRAHGLAFCIDFCDKKWIPNLRHCAWEHTFELAEMQ
jgi:hypothetical protein